MYKSCAVIIGSLLAIMIMLNAGLTDTVGTGPALIVIHITGLTGCGLILFFRKEKINLKSKLPFYFYIGGALGVVMVVMNSIAFLKIGAALTMAATVIGRIIISTIIDHYGLLGMKVSKFNRKKIMGFVFIFTGLMIMTFFG